jgi:hypothetical protein
MTFLPSVVGARYRGAHRIHLVFNDGAEGTVNFRPWLKGPVFEPLKDLDYFRRFFVDGGTVAWPNGADIAPETLYTVAVQQPRPNRRLQATKARRSRSKKASRR